MTLFQSSQRKLEQLPTLWTNMPLPSMGRLIILSTPRLLYHIRKVIKQGC